MRFAFTHGQIVTPEGILPDHSVLIEEGLIKTITKEPIDPQISCLDLKNQLLLPGFIDIQVNGGGGCLLNDNPSVETIAVIAAAHRHFGTTGLLPTLVSEDLNVIKKALSATKEAIKTGIQGILGLHIEGPFIAMKRRGIHAQSKIRSIAEEDIHFLCKAAVENKKLFKIMLTLAPETMPLSIIERLSQAGILVSIGHSDSDYETAQKAIEKGARGFTHLFNAMSQNTGRAPSMVGAALDNEGVYAGIIVDGQHVHPANIRIAFKAKGADRLMLVTDAMPLTGWDRDSFMLQGQMIYRDQGRITDENGVLAGSLLDMATAFANMIKMGHVSIEEASRMASSTPAQFLKLDDRGVIAIGKRADFVVLDTYFKPQSVWIAGKAV
ncbi:MAG: N-acetylglucosamine-6-phosphate deacetylase [Zymomonas mobilis subsp. pomaceae]|uniref:N-acetylglucosamine-6-phosphate deacetylase n=1 Tax=Zymomonas mobilis TaxID=542 RepID=UPI0039EC1884